MDLLIARCAGLDVHQAPVVATVRVPDEQGGRMSVTETFGTMTADLFALREWLHAYGVTHVALESTGVYWKPVYYVLEDGFTLLLINMHELKRVPGRKTDVQDSEWLAQVLECGLLKASFVPPPPICELRDLTRYRVQQVRDRAHEVNRLQSLGGRWPQADERGHGCDGRQRPRDGARAGRGHHRSDGAGGSGPRPAAEEAPRTPPRRAGTLSAASCVSDRADLREDRFSR
jgi:transposase